MWGYVWGLRDGSGFCLIVAGTISHLLVALRIWLSACGPGWFYTGLMCHGTEPQPNSSGQTDLEIRLHDHDQGLKVKKGCARCEDVSWDLRLRLFAGGDGDKSTMSLLSGTWRLVYSSAFASGSLGGFRPGPQAALVPVTIGQV